MQAPTISPGALQDLVDNHPAEAFEAHLLELSSGQIRSCATKMSDEEKTLACSRLTADKIPRVIDIFPSIALRCMLDRLDDRQFQTCVDTYAFGAIRHASHRLTPAQLHECIRKESLAALKLIPEKIPKKLLFKIVKTQTNAIIHDLEKSQCTATAQTLFKIKRHLPPALLATTLQTLAHAV